MAPSNILKPGITRVPNTKPKHTTVKVTKKAAPVTTKTVKFGKETRTVSLVKPKKFYPADSIPIPKRSRKNAKPSTVRASITPGTVLILLAGKFAGSRVVFLKKLDSGLLLVTGPFKVNGVPMRRVNQAYVIATSTKIDISKLAIDKEVNDDYFKVAKSEKLKITAEALFGEGREKVEISPKRLATQKALDTSLIQIIKKETPNLIAYLGAKFGLTNGQYPHALKF